jgi:hypothetical protein
MTDRRGSGKVVPLHAVGDQTRTRRRRQPCLLLYCLACGTVATLIATGLSLIVSGTAGLFVWSAVIASVTITAGLAYDSAVLATAWASRHQKHGEHDAF